MSRQAFVFRFACAAAIALGAPLPRAAEGGPAAPATTAQGKSAMTSVLRGHVLRDAAGRGVRVADWQGQVVVVNFWATWCKPCRKEMPLLDSLHSRMTASGGRVAAVAVDSNPARVQTFLRDHKLKLPVFVDGPEGLIKALDLGGLPYTLVLDRSGRVVHAGPVTPERWTEFERLVDRLLDEGRPTAQGVPS